MTRYRLARYASSGGPKTGQSYRPAGVDGDWAAIDLRPDASRPDGWAFASMPDDTPSAGAFDLGDDRRAIPPASVLRGIENRLGVNLEARPLNRLVADLLIDHAREDGTRWKPLRPERDAWRIYLGSDVLWELPVVSGGATTIFESFTGDSTVDMGYDLTWTQSGGGLHRVDDMVKCGTINTAGWGRAEHDTATDDDQASLDVTIWREGDRTRDAMVQTRMSTASTTDGYGIRRLEFDVSGGPLLLFQKVVGGTFTDLAPQQSVDMQTGPGTGATVRNVYERLRVSANGSTIRGYLGRNVAPTSWEGTQFQDPELYFTVTDTSIPTGRRGGIRMRSTTSSHEVYCDNYRVGPDRGLTVGALQIP